jgi:hypothetical protein
MVEMAEVQETLVWVGQQAPAELVVLLGPMAQAVVLAAPAVPAQRKLPHGRTPRALT